MDDYRRLWKASKEVLAHIESGMLRGSGIDVQCTLCGALAIRSSLVKHHRDCPITVFRESPPSPATPDAAGNTRVGNSCVGNADVRQVVEQKQREGLYPPDVYYGPIDDCLKCAEWKYDAYTRAYQCFHHPYCGCGKHPAVASLAAHRALTGKEWER